MTPLGWRALSSAALVSLFWLSLSAQQSTAPVVLGTPSAIPQDGIPDIFTGPVRGGGGVVRLFSGAPGHALLAEVAPFGAFAGGVRVATGDMDGDGISDLLAAQGPGGGLVRIFSGVDAREIAQGYPFGSAFLGGVNLATGDVNGDGRDDIVVAMATGSWVKIFSLANGLEQLIEVQPYGAAFTQGVRVTTGDLNGDDRADLITSPENGGGAVRVYDGAGPATIVSVPFPNSLYVATGDLTGDGRADVVLSSAGSAGPIVAFDGTTYAPLGSLGPGIPGGISVAVADVTGDGRAEVIGGLGPGAAPLVGVLDGTLSLLLSAFAVTTNAPLPNGVYVTTTTSRGIRFTSAAAATFTTGAAGSFTVTTSAAPAVTSITSSGPLPGGLTFVDNHDGTATLSGTPTPGGGGEYTLTFTATNGVASPVTQSFALRVQGAPRITSAATTTFNVGAAGTFAITTAGFPVPTLTLAGGLPSGVTFIDRGDGTATLAGTPANGAGGTYPVTITAGNGVGANGTQAFTLVVDAAPAFTSAPAATFTVGTPASFAVTATGDPAIATITQTGTLPPGMSFTSNGGGNAVLGGTPTGSGVFTLTFTASNGVGADAVQTFTATVQQVPSITSANMVTFTAGAPATFQVTTVGFPAASVGYTGTLPRGLAFTDHGNGTATIAGTPATGSGGVYSLTVTASNSAGTATGALTITVNEPATITSAASTTFTVGQLGTFLVTTTGAPVPGVSYSGTLPNGVSLIDNGNGTASLGGTPDSGTGGIYTLSLTASNAIGAPAAQSFVLTVNQAPVFTSLASATFIVGTSSTFTVEVDGFPTPTIGMTDALPSGVTLTDNHDGTATLAGTPATGTAGRHTFAIAAHNGVGAPVAQTFALELNETPTITSVDAATFTVGVPGSFTVQTTGTPAPSIARGGVPTLPANVTWVDNGNGTGTLGGTPAAGTIGTYVLTFQASNSAGTSSLQTFTLTVNAAPSFTSAGVASYVVGTAVNFAVTASGTPVPSITQTGGSLPAGVIFNDATDRIEGTPTEVGTFTPQFTASNGVNPNAVQNLSLQITCEPVSVTSSPDTMPNGTFGVAYGGVLFSQSGAATGGAWSATGLPLGLSINPSSGVLGGTAAPTGVFAARVTYTVGACSGSKDVAIIIAPNAQSDLYSPTLGNTQFVAGGFPAPSTPHFSIANGVLANDMASAGTLTVTPVSNATTALGGTITIDANGRFLYTPEVGDTGNDTYVYTVTSNGVSATATITLRLGSSRIWYVKAGAPAGTGASNSPFNSLSPLNGPGDVDDAGDYIFLYGGTYGGGLELETSQWLMGSGSSNTPPDGGGPRGKPTLTGTLTIAGNDVNIEYVDISTGAATGIRNIGTVYGLYVHNRVTITTTTGTAIDFANLSARTSDIESVSAIDPVNGIVLTNVNQGSSGTLTIGSGTTAGAGGIINSASGSGVLMTNSKNIVLRGMTISNSADDGVRGENVSNVYIQYSNISNSGDGNVAAGEHDNGVEFVNVLGSASLSNTTVTLSHHYNVTVDNDNDDDNGHSFDLFLRDNTISQSKVDGGVQIDASGDSHIDVTVTGNNFSAARGSHFRMTAADTAEARLTFTGNTLSGGHPTGLGQNVVFSAATGLPVPYSGLASYDISNNTINGAIQSAIVVGLGLSAPAARLTGTIADNLIGTADSLNSCSAQGHGIAIEAHGNGTHTSLVRDNVIRQCRNLGIEVSANEGHGTLNATLVHNDVQHANGQAAGDGSGEALVMRTGATATPVLGGGQDSHQVCLAVGGPGADANTLQPGPNATTPGDAFRLAQQFSTTVRMPGYTGGAADASAVTSFVSTRNGNAPGSTIAGTLGFSNTPGGAACPVPQ